MVFFLSKNYLAESSHPFSLDPPYFFNRFELLQVVICARVLLKNIFSFFSPSTCQVKSTQLEA
jgi:hypothetical protein